LPPVPQLTVRRTTLFTRTRFQNGSLTMKKRATKERVWEFRYYEIDSRGQSRRRAVTVGSFKKYPTESAARKSPIVQAALLCANAEQPRLRVTIPSFGAVLARYKKEEMPARHSTRAAYRSYLKNHIEPRWADTPLDRVKPVDVEHWLKDVGLAPKSKRHIRSLMHMIYECAQRWELWPLTSRNPLDLVRVPGGSKRQKTIRILTSEEFRNLLLHIREPYRTMVLIAGCLGLRVT
jgi:integrase